MKRRVKKMVRKKVGIFFLFLCLSILGSKAQAVVILNDWTLDLSAVVPTLDKVSHVTNLNWESPGDNTTTIYQYLGSDGILNDGDPFEETGYMQAITLNTNSGLHILDLWDEDNSTQYYLFAVFEDISGHIYNYDDKGNLDPTDDTWGYVFDNYSGNIRICLDTDTDPFNGVSHILMRGSIVPKSTGTADGFLGGSSTVSNWAMTLKITDMYSGVWLDKDGNDLWQKYGQYGWLYALPQGVAQLDGAYSVGYDATKGPYYVFKGHTGDTMDLGVIPEPTSLLLLGGGLLGLAGLGIRRKKKLVR